MEADVPEAGRSRHHHRLASQERLEPGQRAVLHAARRPLCVCRDLGPAGCGDTELHGGPAMRTRGIAIAIAMALPAAAGAQWHGYPTPGIPRLADGRPNLAAPAPRTSDGKPDLSGIWLSSRAVFNLAQAV